MIGNEKRIPIIDDSQESFLASPLIPIIIVLPIINSVVMQMASLSFNFSIIIKTYFPNIDFNKRLRGYTGLGIGIPKLNNNPIDKEIIPNTMFIKNSFHNFCLYNGTNSYIPSKAYAASTSKNNLNHLLSKVLSISRCL